MPMGFETASWWDAPFAVPGPPGQGVAVAADGAAPTAQPRDADALPPGIPKLVQGKEFDLMAADALIVSPMKVDNTGVGHVFAKQDTFLAGIGNPDIGGEPKSVEDGMDDLDSARTTMRMPSDLSNASVVSIPTDFVSDAGEDVLWAAEVPHLPDIIDLGKGTCIETDLQQPIGISPLDLATLGESGDDGMGLSGFTAATLGDDGSEEGENSGTAAVFMGSDEVSPGEEDEVDKILPAGVIGTSLSVEGMVSVFAPDGWGQPPASNFWNNPSRAYANEPPSKRSRSCGTLEINPVCASDSEEAASGSALTQTPNKAGAPGTPRTTGKGRRRASETGKVRSPRGTTAGKPNTPRGNSKAKKSLHLGGQTTKKIDEWDIEGPLPPKPQGPGPQACTNCATINTPLWRGGPHGPKTLCNACGVRYMKSAKRPRDRRT